MHLDLMPWFAVSILLAFPPTLATAGPGSAASVSRLTSVADAIIVGPFQGSIAAQTVSVALVAERVLKGSITQGATVPIVWTDASSGLIPYRTHTVDGHGIFFLQREASGAWIVLPTTNGDTPWAGVYLRTAPNASPNVRSVVSASLPPNPSALDQVLVEMLVNIESGAPLPSEELIELSRQNRSPVLTAAFSRFSSNPDLNFACLGLTGLLEEGDAAVIGTIQQRYASLASARTWPALLDEIKRYYTKTDPPTIQNLGQIATDSNAPLDLRTAAAGALARIHTKETLPYLAKLLGDQDATLRTFAAGGIASFANNVAIGTHEPAAGPWPYRNDDTIAHSGFAEANVSFWQNWWQQNQSTLRK